MPELNLRAGQFRPNQLLIESVWQNGTSFYMSLCLLLCNLIRSLRNFNTLHSLWHRLICCFRRSTGRRRPSAYCKVPVEGAVCRLILDVCKYCGELLSYTLYSIVDICTYVYDLDDRQMPSITIRNILCT